MILLPTRLCPPPAYYRYVAQHPEEPAIHCGGERFDKRCKAAHRFAIADTRGRLELTVPIAKPYGATWHETRVSHHGQWWHLLQTALESAYGRTPYFEFYADDFLPLLSERSVGRSVGELNFEFDRAIRRALGLSAPVSYSPTEVATAEIPEWEPQPYYQVRAHKLGFTPRLSILDIIFNLGPETLLLWR